ncbi:MAG: RNA methyltransferase [Rhodospirillales bacterium]|jgi:tRNA/rRNA methyltransferase|nr:RNA methyltransferase [Rhodospirillales bacterium]MDP6773421.1 RNA methyltransferase [Rhodospirillales bacterium]
MAGTDSTKASLTGGSPAGAGGGAAPAVVLVEPQLGENIGMTARAMLNCGLAELRLVRPREDWPNDKAVAAASGADAVLDGTVLYETTAQAIADLETVYAATARPRDMTKRVMTARHAAGEMRELAVRGRRLGVLLGPEAMGLNNDDVALADAVVTIPLNPAFMSLNLAQAVFAIAYEWHQALAMSPGSEDPGAALAMPKETRPATKAELMMLFEHLEGELDACGFLHVTEKRPIMVRNLRNLLQRAQLTEQEVRTLRGAISGLSSGRKG